MYADGKNSDIPNDINDYAKYIQFGDKTETTSTTTNGSYIMEKIDSKISFHEIISNVTVSICLIVTIWCLAYWTFGGFAKPNGYTINRVHNANPAPLEENIYYNVIEIRNDGRDRKIYTTYEFDDAYMVLQQMIGIPAKVGKPQF
jgi:hypothetical protein